MTAYCKVRPLELLAVVILRPDTKSLKNYGNPGGAVNRRCSGKTSGRNAGSWSLAGHFDASKILNPITLLL